MNKKELTPEEEEQVESDFLRKEAERQAAEAEEKREKRRRFIRSFPFEALMFFWVMTIGMSVFDIFLEADAIQTSDLMLLIWMTAATFAMLSLRRMLRDLEQNQPKAGNGGKGTD